jgi:hypothetical protein
MANRRAPLVLRFLSVLPLAGHRGRFSVSRAQRHDASTEPVCLVLHRCLAGDHGLLLVGVGPLADTEARQPGGLPFHPLVLHYLFPDAFVAAVGTAASYALASRTGFAVGAAAIATLTLVLRARLIPRMDRLGIQIQGQDAIAIPEFRRIHKSAILINTVQLGAILGVWARSDGSAGRIAPPAPDRPQDARATEAQKLSFQ